MKVIMLDDERQAHLDHWPVRSFHGFQQLRGTPRQKSRAEYDMQKICGFPLQNDKGEILPGGIYKETKRGQGGAGTETQVIMLDSERAADPLNWPVRPFDFGLEQFDGNPGLIPRYMYDMHRICDFALRDAKNGAICPGAIYEETRRDAGGVRSQARNR